MRRDVLLGLDFTNNEGLLTNAKIGGSLGYSDYGMVELRSRGEEKKK